MDDYTSKGYSLSFNFKESIDYINEKREDHMKEVAENNRIKYLGIGALIVASLGASAIYYFKFKK